MKNLCIKLIIGWLFFQIPFHAQAQYDVFAAAHINHPELYQGAGYLPIPKRKLYQRNTGVILGLQKGKFTTIEMGGEAHWRKISLRKAYIIGANLNLEYNPGSNVLGYKAGGWFKRGNINLTYGANVGYYTNFNNGHRFGIAPSVGFRLLGFHLINGVNILTKDNAANTSKPVEVNTLYMSLRYYFPVQNQFVWDRATRKRIKERKQARADRKKERQKRRENGEGGLFNIFKKKK